MSISKSRPAERLPFNLFKDAQRSMLGKDYPSDYAKIETAQDAMEHAKIPPPNVILRLTIVWDNDIASLDLERVLEKMRETGAAMVIESEQVSE